MHNKIACFLIEAQETLTPITRICISLMLLLSFLNTTIYAQYSKFNDLPVLKKDIADHPQGDWLLGTTKSKSQLYRSKDGKDLILTNGLISRTFRIAPNLVAYSFRNHLTADEMLRSVEPEAELTIDSTRYKIGGVKGIHEKGYLYKKWLDDATVAPNSFRFSDVSVQPIQPRFAWKKERWTTNTIWPPKGKEVTFYFEPPPGQASLKGLNVKVHYNIYDGIPLISKWIEVDNNSKHSFTLNSFKSEILACREEENTVDDIGIYGGYEKKATQAERKRFSVEGYKIYNYKHGRYYFLDRPNIHIETDYSFYGFSPKTANHSVSWIGDSTYTSQVDSHLKNPSLLNVTPEIGPQQPLTPREQFSTFRTYELLYDSYRKERKGLAMRKMYRMIAPWITENPIYLHVTFSSISKVKKAIDQCAEVGFEMIILSFGSGLNMEDLSDKNIKKYKRLVDYAESKGIELGGYSLESSRHINVKNDVIDPQTGNIAYVAHGGGFCLGSKFGLNYLKKIKTFIKKTGFLVFENDGPYPGHICGSTKHPGHNGTYDSQWNQWKLQTDLYKWCRKRGVYITAPDWYFLSGSNKIGIGYKETNWSLPRAQQIMLGRQNIYDGTWKKTPSMGWTFIPLTEYHGGGKAATIEPLKEHLHAYESHMVQDFGAGVQAAFRGPRLYDAPQTKKLVTSMVNWYKKYRNILNSDIIHLRRPDGRDWDGILHVNPNLKRKGLAMLYNPLDHSITRTIRLSLYYTGLTKKAKIRKEEGRWKTYKLSREYKVTMEVTIPAQGYTWFLIK